MAKRNWRQGLALACDRAADRRPCLLPVPAGAQFFGSDQPASEPPAAPPPQRGFFVVPVLSAAPGSGPFYQARPPPQQPTESFKAPSPRKYETPPTSTVMVIGDSMADWLAYGLEEALVRFAGYRRGAHTSKRPPVSFAMTPRTICSSGRATIKDVLATEKPSAIVVMLGLNDRLPFRDKAPPKPGTPQSGTPARSCASARQDNGRAAAVRRREAERRAAPDRRQRAATPRPAGLL